MLEAHTSPGAQATLLHEHRPLGRQESPTFAVAEHWNAEVQAQVCGTVEEQTCPDPPGGLMLVQSVAHAPHDVELEGPQPSFAAWLQSTLPSAQ